LVAIEGQQGWRCLSGSWQIARVVEGQTQFLIMFCPKVGVVMSSNMFCGSGSRICQWFVFVLRLAENAIGFFRFLDKFSAGSVNVCKKALNVLQILVVSSHCSENLAEDCHVSVAPKEETGGYAVDVFRAKGLSSLDRASLKQRSEEGAGYEAEKRDEADEQAAVLFHGVRVLFSSYD